MKRQSSRLIASFVALTLILGCINILPAMAQTEEYQWKLLHVTGKDTNKAYSLAKILKRTMEIPRVLNIPANEEGAEEVWNDFLLRIHFSMEFTQNYNIALYRIKNGFTLNKGSVDSTMLGNYFSSIDDGGGTHRPTADPTKDPRDMENGFLGYLQICDENGENPIVANEIEFTGYEERDIDYAPAYRDTFALNSYSNGTNTVYWNGKIKKADGTIGYPQLNSEYGDQFILAIEPMGKVIDVPEEYLERDEDGNPIPRRELVNWARDYISFTGLIINQVPPSQLKNSTDKNVDKQNPDCGGDRGQSYDQYL